MIIGIDLAASENRKTGIAIMHDMDVETRVVYSDDEVIDIIKQNNPELVVMDAPLSLPEKGGLRAAEKELCFLGVPALPLNMKSMKALAIRAIRLKEKMGCEVIETYCAASKTFFGINGKTHELDAMVCALVGVLYLKGDVIRVGEVILPLPDITTLKKAQIRAKKSIEFNGIGTPTSIGGVAQAFFEDWVVSCICVFDYPRFALIEKRCCVQKRCFWYIPGLMYYSCGAGIIEAYNMLKNKPNVLMINAHGIAHPRLGMASQIGVDLDIATIGVAKNLLVGKVVQNKIVYNAKQVGWALGRHVFLSPGNKVRLDECLDIGKQCLDGGFPLPIKTAQRYAKEVKSHGYRHRII